MDARENSSPPEGRVWATGLARYSLYIACGIAALALYGVGRDYLFFDDHFILSEIDGTLERDAPWVAYDMSHGTAEDVQARKARGELGWWVGEEFRLRFNRPLSVLLHRAEWRAAGRSPVVYHAVSALVLFLLVLACHRLYVSQLRSKWLGGLAAILFAGADFHTELVVWMSARHHMLATLLGVVAILFHVKSRERHNHRAAMLRVASVSAFIVGLGFGEIAIGTLGYILAYELVGRRREPRVPRLLAIAPLFLFGFAYVGWYTLSAHGVKSALFWINPLQRPGLFFLRAVALVPWILGDLGTGALVDLPSRQGVGPTHLVASFGAAVAVAALVLGTLFRAKWLPDDDLRTVGWLTAGSLLCLPPALTGDPGVRLFLQPWIGLSVSMALVLAHLARMTVLPSGNKPALVRRIATGVLTATLLVAHLVLGPYAKLGVANTFYERSARHKAARYALRRGQLQACPTGSKTGAAELPEVVALAAPFSPPGVEMGLALTLPPFWKSREPQSGKIVPTPLLLAWLAEGELRLHRINDSTLEVTATDNYLVPHFFRGSPMKSGYVAPLGRALEVQVVEVDLQGHARRVRLVASPPHSIDTFCFITINSELAVTRATGFETSGSAIVLKL